MRKINFIILLISFTAIYSQSSNSGFVEYTMCIRDSYYTDSNEKTTYLQKTMFGDLLLISYETSDWKLINETKTIGDYKCYKAVKNAEVNSNDVVWYTPEIAVPFGPTLYNGLPGLVLEVNIGKIRIIASKLSLNKESNLSLEKPKKGIEITQKDYEKKLNEFADEIGF